MGWIILALLFLLFLLPFLIPVRIKLRLDETTRDWALFYGLFQLAPDTTQRLEDLRVRVVRWTRIPLFVLLSLVQGLLLPFQLLFLLFKAIRWPFSRFADWRRAKRAAKRQAEFERAKLDAPVEPDATEPVVEEGTEEEGRLDRPDSMPGMEVESEGTDEPSDSSDLDELNQPDSPWDVPDEKTGESSDEHPASQVPPGDREDPGATSAREESAGEEKQGPFGKLRAAFTGVRSLREKIDLYLGYVHEYSPLAKKVLRRLFRFMGQSMRAFRFRTFDAHLRMGGDPATLGAMLGWHHALAASLHPSIPHHLVFEPDYDSEELAPRGTLDLELVIWPYRFLLPTLILVVTLPYWSAFRAYRKFRKQHSA